MKTLSRVIAVFTVALSSLRTAEDTPLFSLIAPTTAVAAGATIDVQVVVLNQTAGAVAFALPATLTGKIAGLGRCCTVTLRSLAVPALGGESLAAGAFFLRNYTLTVPSAAPPGITTLEVSPSGMGTVKAALEIGGAPVPASAQTTATPQRPPTNLVRAEPAAAALRRTFADRLGAHEPLYFIYGPNAPAAKFQFSFKYKVLDFATLAPQRMARTLQFAFTQRSLWDINGVSSPFYDTSYMPELIYESLAARPEESDHWFTWLGSQVAFKHESNGRDGPRSRSLNTVYCRTALALGRLDGWYLLAIPEVFSYVSLGSGSPDLEDYRDYGRLQFAFGRNDRFTLMAAFWAGRNFRHGSLQLDLTIPVRAHLLNFETYALVQYFNGYGESLLSYREKSETARAGFSLVR